MEKTASKYSEVKIDHIDENGVAHIDSFKTPDDNETGVVLGYIMNGEIYWKHERAINDPLVQSVVAEYIVGYKAEQERKRIRERDNAGTILGEEFSRFVNNYNCKEDQFVEKILNDHPTLQQSSMRVILKVVEGMAAKEYVDGRNQSSRDVCRKLLAGYTEEWVKLFMERDGDSEEKARKYVTNEAFRPSNLPYV